MAAGDKPMMVHSGQVVWEKEATFGSAPAGATWNPFGYRLGDVTDPGVENVWNELRAWQAGREAVILDRMAKNYGGTSLGEFRLTDLRLPGFAWGQEVSAPAALGGGYYRHTATPTVRHPADSLALQIHDEDADANAVRGTYLGGVMTEVEIAGNEGGEVSYTPTFLFRKMDTGVAKKSVTAPSTTSYKHHHGYIEVFGQQLIRVISWRFRKVSEAERARYWNDTEPLLAYEYPLQDVNYVLTARTVVDGKQFSGFGSRSLIELSENGDLGQATLRFRKTLNQDEGLIQVGSSNNALGIRGAPRERSATGGKVIHDVDFVCKTSNYQWIDQNASRYFAS